jgi:cyclomaltodextrinase / maltogenic alpha-amylase / neopullulanase
LPPFEAGAACCSWGDSSTTKGGFEQNLSQINAFGDGVVWKLSIVWLSLVCASDWVAAQSNQADRGGTPSHSLAHRGFIPDWPQHAVFYQIFPERFRNGDHSNDPDHASLEFPDVVPNTWKISPWGGDWYERAPWEVAMGVRFYDDGVFHRRYGGDLQGILEKLDYLRDLGVTCIYFNPVFYARSLHKYDGSSFHHIDPHFGPSPAADFQQMSRETSDPATWGWTGADRLFLKLIEEAHNRSLRVIVDGVFNHTGRDFFAFDDIRRRQKDSAYTDWYTVEAWDDPQTPASEFRYRCWWGIDTLPEFADSSDKSDLHPGPKKYLYDITRRWMDPNGDGSPADGIDGWRLDVANEVPDKFWQDWNIYVRKLNPDAYTVAEIWDDAAAYLDRCHFSASMNYHGFAFLVKGFLIDNTLSSYEFVKEMTERRNRLGSPRHFAMQNLVDSHDTDRVASMIVNASRFSPSPPQSEPQRTYRQPNRFDFDVGEHVSPRHDATYLVRKPSEDERMVQRIVALFQMTSPGAPMIYYGTEAGMWGGDDPDDRMPMVWQDIEFSPQRSDPRPGAVRPPDGVAFDSQLHDYYQALLRLRGGHPALRTGDIQYISLPDCPQAIAYLRVLGEERYLIIINRNGSPLKGSCELPLASTTRAPIQSLKAQLLLTSWPNPSNISLSFKAGNVDFVLPGICAAIWKLSP